MTGFRLSEERILEGKPASLDAAVIPTLTVEAIDNHVYYYADVNADRCLALMRTIRELDGRLRNERVSRSLPANYPMTPVWLHIQSFGGDVFAGLSVADQLKTIQTPVYSIVEGLCASAATLISMACGRRYVMPSAFMLIHQVSTISWGTYEQIKDDIHMLDLVMSMLTKFYSNKSKLSEETVREMLRHDSWFNAQECLKHGLVDVVFGQDTN